MDILLLLFLPVILALGIATSYGDIKEGKIRNKYIFSAIIFGFVMYSVLFLMGLMDIRHILILLAGLFFSLCLGFLFWHFGFWSAGDAKLFTAYAFLIPPNTYVNYLPPLPWFSILTNAAIPLFFYLVFFLMLKTGAKRKWDILWTAIKSPGWFFRLLIYLFCVDWLFTALTAYTGIAINYFYRLLLMIVIYRLINRLLEKDAIYLFCVAGVIRLALNPAYFLTPRFLIPFFSMTLLISLGRIFIMGLSGIFSGYVRMDDIEEGMIPGETFAVFYNRNGPGLPPKRGCVHIKTGQNLSKRAVFHLRQLYLSGKFKKRELLIKKSIPFAPFLFAGALLVIFCSGDFAMFIWKLLG